MILSLILFTFIKTFSIMSFFSTPYIIDDPYYFFYGPTLTPSISLISPGVGQIDLAYSHSNYYAVTPQPQSQSATQEKLASSSLYHLALYYPDTSKYAMVSFGPFIDYITINDTSHHITSFLNLGLSGKLTFLASVFYISLEIRYPFACTNQLVSDHTPWSLVATFGFIR